MAESSSTSGGTASKLDEYRGANKWKGLIPSPGKERKWDENFRSFLVKYGMICHITYDVWIKGEGDGKGELALSGTSRYGEDLDAFTKKGLEFSYKNKDGKKETEYNFTKEYHVVCNLVCSPRSLYGAENNWFGFAMLSNDLKEVVIAFRGTQTRMEWIENLTFSVEQLADEPEEAWFAKLFNRQNLMCHKGFQQLFTQKSTVDGPSPKEVIEELAKKHKDTLEKVTLVGHSLGGAMAQLCGVHLARSKVLGDVPITVIAWAAPKIGNPYLAKWAEDQHPRLRILRISVTDDFVTKVPRNWTWVLLQGGFKHMGTELRLNLKHLIKEKLVKEDDGIIDENSGPAHNLQQYLYNIHPGRDPALMNKFGDVLNRKYSIEHNISPYWHNQTWPRTVYDDKC